MDGPWDTLETGEATWLNLRRHWKVLVRPALWMVLALGVLAIGAVVLPATVPAYIILSVVVLGIFLPFILWPFLAWRNTRYVFTNDRVTLVDGVFKIRRRDILLLQVSDVKSTQTVIDRVLGCGTLTIQFSDHRMDRSVLKSIPHVVQVHEGILRRSSHANRQQQTRGDQLHEALSKLLQDGDSGAPTAGGPESG